MSLKSILLLFWGTYEMAVLEALVFSSGRVSKPGSSMEMLPFSMNDFEVEFMKSSSDFFS